MFLSMFADVSEGMRYTCVANKSCPPFSRPNKLEEKGSRRSVLVWKNEGSNRKTQKRREINFFSRAIFFLFSSIRGSRSSHLTPQGEQHKSAHGIQKDELEAKALIPSARKQEEASSSVKHFTQEFRSSFFSFFQRRCEAKRLKPRSMVQIELLWTSVTPCDVGGAKMN